MLHLVHRVVDMRSSPTSSTESECIFCLEPNYNISLHWFTYTVVTGRSDMVARALRFTEYWKTHITRIYFPPTKPTKAYKSEMFSFREHVWWRRDQVLRQLGTNICVNQYRVCVLRYGKRTANNRDSPAWRMHRIVQPAGGDISVLFCTLRACYFSDRPARDLIWIGLRRFAAYAERAILIYIRIAHISWPKHCFTTINASPIELMANMELELLMIWHTVWCLQCPRYGPYLHVKYEDILPDNIHA